MFDSLEIFRMASAMASHSGRRQALVAENMANVDTPGYLAQRLPSFADLAQEPGQHPVLLSSRSSHLHGGESSYVASYLHEVKDNPSPDGNTVTVETEMLEAINVEREHSRALAIYRSALNILHANLARA